MHLARLAEIQMGYPFRSRLERDPGGGVTVIQMKDIDEDNVLQPEGAVRVSLPTAKSHHLLRAGDLLFRSRGQSNGAAQVPEGIGTAVLSAPMLLIRPNGALPEYLCWFINSLAAQLQLRTLAAGTSVRMISAEALKALDVPVPPMATQRRIAQLAGLVEEEQSLLGRITAARHRLTTHILMQHAQKATS